MAEDNLRALQDGLVARYLIAASCVCLLYDHLITLEAEVSNVWGNPHTKKFYKATFVLHRYVADILVIMAAYVTSGHGLNANVCKNFIWVFTIVVVVILTSSQLYINMRIYQTWETRPIMNNISNCIFTILAVAALAMSVVVAIQVQSVTIFEAFKDSNGMCAFSQVPKSIPIMLGILALFDFSLIILAVYNALEKPHKSHAQALDAFYADGAKVFLFMFAFGIVSLVVSIFENAAYTSAILCMSFVFNSSLVCRIHLRAEGLRFLRFIEPVYLP